MRVLVEVVAATAGNAAKVLVAMKPTSFSVVDMSLLYAPKAADARMPLEAPEMFRVVVEVAGSGVLGRTCGVPRS
jgi:hypothetical protein